MKIAIISDIHGNLAAFEQVLSDIEGSGAGALICLGDNVGYGPDPEGVITLLKRHGIPSVRGNHDHAVAEPKFLKWFNKPAKLSLEKTIEMMSKESLDYEKSLERYMILENCRFVHGYPPDDFKTYLFQAKKSTLLKTFREMTEWVCFVGHTHDLEIIQRVDEKTAHLPFKKGVTTLKKEGKYLINIGSVGQPRDGDNRSKYVLFDTASGDIELRCVSYDIESVVQKIRSLGLPESHARRLR